MGVLAEILAHKRRELVELRRRVPPVTGLRPRPLRLARRAGEPLRLLAEIKLRSPSAGPLSRVLGVADRARAYERAGASALSVLTDSAYFDGAFAHLSEARAATGLPVLCKEFVLDEIQLDWARACGADAVLLIVRCLEAERLAPLIAAARARELTPLVEVATLAEAAAAVAAGAELVGVNARDLDTLALDPERAARVLDSLPQGVTRVHLSGVGSALDVRRLAERGLDAALVGEALMRQDDPTELLTELRHAAG